MAVESILPPDPDHRPIWRLPWIAIVLAAVLSALTIWMFRDGMDYMWDAWTTSAEYSYGLLIPLVAAFLVWRQKDLLERLRFDGSWAGVALVFLGGFMLLLGQLGAIYTIVQYGWWVTICGLTLAFTGRDAFRLVIAPLTILLFMIPLPQFVLGNLSTKLQLLSSQIGVWFIRLAGISVFAEGNVIDLGGYKLQVAEACDGLRYLFPLMTIGFLMAYFYRGSMWKRILLFLSSIPITVMMNSFRIGTIGVMVEHWGISMAEGFLHEFQGWAVFMVSAGLMIAEMIILNRIGHEPGSWRQQFGVEFPNPTPHRAVVRHRKLPVPFIAAGGVLAALALISLLVPRPAEISPTRVALAEFPNELGPWAGRRDSLDRIFIDALKLDDYVLENFDDGRQWPVNLYVAYYESQRKGEAVHSPRSCLPGGGWQLREFDQRTIGGTDLRGGVALRVNRTIIELGSERQLVYYWFQQRGRVVTNEFMVKWYIFWDALTRHRTDGALVRLIAVLPPAVTVEEADRRLSDVASRVVPILNRYVPD